MSDWKIWAALFTAAILTSCASGGSGGSRSVTQYQSTTGGGGGMMAGNCGSMMGGMMNDECDSMMSGGMTSTGFAIDAPLIATEGVNTTPSPAAVEGGNSFSTAASGTVFPLLQAPLAFSASGITADSDTSAGGASLTFLRRSGTSEEFELNIPSLGIRAAFVADDDVEDSIAMRGSIAQLHMRGLDYVRFGRWILRDGVGDQPIRNGAFFIAGFRTPVENLPQSGSARYRGHAGGLVFVPRGDGYVPARLAGDAALIADFGAHTVSGMLTEMTATGPAGNTSAWNDVGVSANIGTQTSGFRGTTAATSAPDTPFALDASATGHVAGSFFGPRANEIGAVWSLKDGSGAAFGVIGADRQ
jgi:hypothetical protein